jgi:hypothetical protein
MDDAGLCATCRHMRLIRSDRGAEFYLCKLSATDQSFAKYPALPVVRCSGYLRKNEEKDDWPPMNADERG